MDVKMERKGVTHKLHWKKKDTSNCGPGCYQSGVNGFSNPGENDVVISLK